MTRIVTTVELETTAIKLMETRDKSVTRWASRYLEAGIIEEGVVLDPPALGAALKQLMASSGMNGGNVIASVCGLFSANRILTVSAEVPAAALSHTVLEAAKETMPLDTSNLYLSWQIVATTDSRHQCMVIGVPQDVIDTEVQALKAAGLSPRMLDFKAIALARAVNKEHALILNIDSTSFDIIMLINNIPEVMRTVAWHTEDFTLEEMVEHLAVTLELTAGFYNSHHGDAPLDPSTPLFITGQMSVNSALIGKLQARLEYHIETMVPPLECPPHMPVSQYAVNIGLALKGMVPAAKNMEKDAHMLPELNLLPDIYKPWKPSPRQIYITSFILAAVALLFPLYQTTDGAVDKGYDLEGKYIALNDQMQQRQAEIKNRAPLQEAINEYRTIVAMGSGFTGDINVIESEAATLGIKTESISHNGNSITITCIADNYEAFRDYLSALEKSGRFTTPIPPPEGYPYTTSGTISLTPVSVGEKPAK